VTRFKVIVKVVKPLVVEIVSAHLSHRNYVRPSVCLTGGSVKSGASYNHQIFTLAARKTLVA